MITNRKPLPVCESCQHHVCIGSEERENRWRYKHICNHSKAKKYNGGLLGVSKSLAPVRKTCPKWCPKREGTK